MKTKTKQKPVQFHQTMMKLAKEEIKRHVMYYDGEKCFNIFSYLQALESKIGELFFSDEFPIGDFELNAHGVARYLWVCLTLEEGEQTYGDTFRGMPMLD